MEKDRLQTFLQALKHQDAQALEPAVTEDFCIRSPILDEPFVGKAASLSILKLLFSVVDALQVRDVLESPTHVALFVGLRVGDIELDGVNYIHFNDGGQVNAMTVMWRPLSGLVVMQNRLASKLGAPPLKLVEREAGPVGH